MGIIAFQVKPLLLRQTLMVYEDTPTKKNALIGLPGSGKSTFACKLGEILGISVHHLDTHMFEPDGKKKDKQEFIEIQQYALSQVHTTHYEDISSKQITSLPSSLPSDVIKTFNSLEIQVERKIKLDTKVTCCV